MERQAKKEAAGDDGNSRYALEDADGGKKESRGRGTKRDEMPGKCVWRSRTWIRSYLDWGAANRRTETPFNVAGNPVFRFTDTSTRDHRTLGVTLFFSLLLLPFYVKLILFIKILHLKLWILDFSLYVRHVFLTWRHSWFLLYLN